MIRELNDHEYEDLLSTYGCTSFMGGCVGTDESATIYLYEGKNVLISNDEPEAIQHALACQRLEAEKYHNEYVTFWP